MNKITDAYMEGTSITTTLARTPSLSDAHAEATEIWAEVGNPVINNFSTCLENKEFDTLVYAVALNDESFVKSFMEILTTFNHRSAD